MERRRAADRRKEVAQRRPDSRLLLAVPRDAHRQLPQKRALRLGVHRQGQLHLQRRDRALALGRETAGPLAGRRAYIRRVGLFRPHGGPKTGSPARPSLASASFSAASSSEESGSENVGTFVPGAKTV